VRRAATATVLVGLLAAALASVPAVQAAPAPPRELSFLRVGGASGPSGLPQVIDSHGRQVLLKGVNADGLVDYWRKDLRPPYPSDAGSYADGRCAPDDPSVEGVPVCDFDIAQMRPLGYDTIRLNLSWSLLEPQPGRIDATYLDRIAQVVRWAKAAGIYVVLDMHQDAWSKYVYSGPGDVCVPPYQPTVGYDGAPQWASTHSSPACALNGVRELDTAVAEDFQKLYDDDRAPDGVGLQEHYASVLIALAKRFHDEPAVAGYEIINEPNPGFAPAPGAQDATELFPFYGKMVTAVTNAVPGFRQLFFVEPDTIRNVTDQREVLNAWSSYSSYPNVVYAPHVYTGVFTADQEVASTRFFPSDNGYRSVALDAKVLGLPLWVGEFGNSPQDDDTLLTTSYRLQDTYAISGTLWLWKENRNDTNPDAFWGVYGPPFGQGTPQLKRIALTSRAFPLYTAGKLTSMSYDPAAGSFDVHATSPRVECGDRDHATLLFVPRAYGGPISAEHARVDSFDRDGSREAYVYPDGGAYRAYSGASPAPSCGGRDATDPHWLPARRACVDRRRFRFRLRQPRGGRIVSIAVYVNGRRVLRKRGHRIAAIAIRRLPLGTFEVRIAARTSLGRRIVSSRVYRGCAKSRPRTRTLRGHRRHSSHR
jgi:endoglycosylceramidase